MSDIPTSEEISQETRELRQQWRCVSMHDPAGRRGVWVRMCEDGAIEVRGGREGDDACSILRPGDTLTPADIKCLLGALEYGAWMQEDYGPATDKIPFRECDKSFGD